MIGKARTVIYACKWLLWADSECAKGIVRRYLGRDLPPAGTQAELISEIAAEIAAECQVTTLKAQRLARGWTVVQAVDAFHRMCRREGIKARGLTTRSWMDWEAGDRPNLDYQDLVSRLFHASAVHLGWATDYSRTGTNGVRGSLALSAAAAPARTAVIERAGEHDGRRRSLLHLPPDIGDFTGRAEQVEQVALLLAEAVESARPRCRSCACPARAVPERRHWRSTSPTKSAATFPMASCT
jgi:hypothetical protein